MNAHFLGIDIGTQGVRVLLTDETGNVAGSVNKVFELSASSREEQSPYMWWEDCLICLQELLQQQKVTAVADTIKAVAVTSTSGTVIPLDKDYKPLHNAIMYSDKRSEVQGKVCTGAALKHQPHGYTTFNSSSGLAKMVWFIETYPEKAKEVKLWAHAADYITGQLCGRWGVTDFTNALKSGYDLHLNAWPDYLIEKLPLSRYTLPEVLPSGEVIGTIKAELANKLGLPATIALTTGVTDGCASQFASGAINPGDWNTTIGTTLVIKGVTINEIVDPMGRIYNHKHPSGYWMPGGASNTGADWVTEEFGEGLTDLNKEAANVVPTGLTAYPLRQQGERFPFIAPQARGFKIANDSRVLQYAANMEGVAYIERYAYELMEKLSGEKVNIVFTAGGASNSNTWSVIRSNVLNRPVRKMKEVSGAFGAAILAASKSYYTSINEAAQQMTRVDDQFLPETTLTAQYNDGYDQFIGELTARGYLKQDIYG